MAENHKTFIENELLRRVSKPSQYLGTELNSVHKDNITVKCKRSRGYAFETFSFSVNELGLPFVVGEIYDPLKYFVTTKQKLG